MNRLSLLAGPTSVPSTNFSSKVNHYVVTGGAASVTITGFRCAICPIGDAIWVSVPGGTAAIPAGTVVDAGSFPIPDGDRRLFEMPDGAVTFSWIANSGTARVGVERWDA